MKLLAISDSYIPSEFMNKGLAQLQQFGVDIEVRHWAHPNLVALQQANLAIENAGPEAVALGAQLTDNVDDFDIIVVQFAPVSRHLIAAAASLKVIGVLRSGAENIDVEFATQRGIAVMNTPGRNARAVAECTIGLILAETRNIARSHACLKNANWRRSFPNSDAIPELLGKTVGLVGYGAVGQLVAGYLNAFGCNIIAYDPYFKGDSTPAKLVDLQTLMRASDVVSIHARLTEESRHLIDHEHISLMKPTAVLVNTARSALVDEQALVGALQQRCIMAAALDVFDTEPLPPDHPLLKLDNVTITPHIAGSTIDAFRNSPKLMADHLTRMLKGQGPLPVINGIIPKLAQSPERQ
ncbi:MAG: 2-hydroxyacid dehydrogenase [Planctomycetota bacterium]|jgi:D-3-phosphoglycerate dehydrogenase